MIFSLGACSSKEEPAKEVVKEKPVLKIGAIPDQNSSKLNRRFDELAKYIGEKANLEVEYVPSVDYAALVTAFERGDIHLAWFGGLTGVQARNQEGQTRRTQAARGNQRASQEGPKKRNTQNRREERQALTVEGRGSHGVAGRGVRTVRPAALQNAVRYDHAEREGAH